MPQPGSRRQLGCPTQRGDGSRYPSDQSGLMLRERLLTMCVTPPLQARDQRVRRQSDARGLRSQAAPMRGTLTVTRST